MKVKKRVKSSRFRGSHTHARGFKKKARGSGHRGGKGMAGTGKRGDQRKTLILNLYGNDYFGKGKVQRRKVAPKLKVINIRAIMQNPSRFGKESGGIFEVNLKGYKILGEGELDKKIKIIASEISKSASEKVKKAGGEIVIV